MYDSHTHLSDEKLFEDWRKHVDDFITVGGLGLITVGTDKVSNKQVIEICSSVEEADLACLVKCCVGFHPYEVVSNSIKAQDLNRCIKDIYDLYVEKSDHIVAIGEIGIDLHYKNSADTLLVQQNLLAFQCDLALQLGLPVVIHSRDAFKETLAVLQDFPDLVTYFHCRGYSPDELEFLTSRISKLYVGFCGNLTYKKAEGLRESIKILSNSSLLLETDAPYLTVQKFRGEQNDPAMITHLYDYVSELLGLDKDDLISLVGNNFRSLYNVG